MPAKKLLVVLLLFCTVLAVKAQDTTRVIHPSTKFITEQDINLNLPYRDIDTSMNRVEIFHQGYKNTVFQDLGNIGTPIRPLLYTADRNVGFQYGFNPFETYFIKPEATRFYKTHTPYTDLFYAQGSNELLYLQARHSQNILPRWNVGLDYQRITSQGFYLRQLTSIYNYQFYTHYHSKDQRYQLLAHATWNRGSVQESGGITDDSTFESLTGPNKRVNARLNQSQTLFKARSGYLKQYYRLGRGRFTKNEDDSTYDFSPRFQVSHTLHAEEISYVFLNDGDVDSVLLPHKYYDVTSNTYDSARFGRLSNQLDLNVFDREHHFLGDSVRDVFSAGIRHELINVSQIAYVRKYDNLVLSGAWEQVSLTDNAPTFMLKGTYDLMGYNSGDYKLEGLITLRTPWAYLRVNGTVQQFRPDFTMQLFKSNQFIWNNNFDRTYVQRLGVGLSSRGWRHNLHLNYNQYIVTKSVIANEQALPEQLGSSAIITTLEASKTFQVWKLFFEHTLIYQHSTEDKIRLPEVSGMIRYYVQARLFKVMRFQLGFAAFYNTAYYGNAYNPASRLFYLQNSRRIGNYPVVDPFFAGEIKRATIFVKYEHANQDLINTGFYYTPNYPISLSSLRFGVRWRFYD